MGIIVFVRLSIRRWEGELILSDHGVFRYSNKAKCKSFLSCMAFFINLLTVCTAFSAIPFDWGVVWAGCAMLELILFGKALKFIARKLWSVIMNRDSGIGIDQKFCQNP